MQQISRYRSEYFSSDSYKRPTKAPFKPCRLELCNLSHKGSSLSVFWSINRNPAKTRPAVLCRAVLCWLVEHHSDNLEGVISIIQISPAGQCVGSLALHSNTHAECSVPHTHTHKQLCNQQDSPQKQLNSTTPPSTEAHSARKLPHPTNPQHWDQ